MIGVLIVDDSVTQREIFARMLADDSELTVVGHASNGREAVEKVRSLAPDVVLMDIHMPGMDGIEATVEIMRKTPVPIVVASATLRKRDVDLAMQAYQAGAVSVIEKPEGAVLLHLKKLAPTLRNELIAASKAKVRRTTGSDSTRSAAPVETSASQPIANRKSQISNIDVIGICASTGGPPVLLEIISALPKPFPIPVLLVQHISRGFEDGFTRWLANVSGQVVGIAQDGQRLSPGVWMAPNGRHLTLGSATRLALPEGKPAEIHCPSGNPLFASLAKLVASKAAGVILTGMGDDGAAGLLQLRRAGGQTLIQNEASSMIYGMPGAASRLDAADQECSPAEIAAALARMAARRPL